MPRGLWDAVAVGSGQQHRPTRWRVATKVAAFGVVGALGLGACHADPPGDGTAPTQPAVATSEATGPTTTSSTPEAVATTAVPVDRNAPQYDTDYCQQAIRFFTVNEVPKPADLRRLASLAPPEIAREAKVVGEALAGADGDLGRLMAVLATDEIEDAAAVLSAFEDEQCGTGHAVENIVLPEGATLQVEPKATRVDVTAVDHRFHMATLLHPGRTSFVLRNTGSEAHRLLIAKLAPGAKPNVDRILSIEGDPSLGGRWVSGLAAPGGVDEEALTLGLAPGDYVLMCNAAGSDGVPRAQMGMVLRFTVA